MNPSDLETAVSRGHAFLLRTQHGEGWWADFWLSPGKSDGWVTAYAGGVVAAAGDAGSRSAACAAWQWLARRPSPGWGYNGLTPDDADSTAWAIRLAEVVGAGHTERMARARALLATHVHPDGGVSTYGDDGAIRSFIGAPAGLRFDGWCRPQPCVTAAAAAGGLGDGAVLRYLRAVQKDDGHWLSYWWCEDEYATAMAATALGRHGRDRDDNLRVAQAAAWAAGRLGSNGYAVSSVCPTGSPFATALALRTLGHGGKGGDNAARCGGRSIGYSSSNGPTVPGSPRRACGFHTPATPPPSATSAGSSAGQSRAPSAWTRSASSRLPPLSKPSARC